MRKNFEAMYDAGNADLPGRRLSARKGMRQWSPEKKEEVKKLRKQAKKLVEGMQDAYFYAPWQGVGGRYAGCFRFHGNAFRAGEPVFKSCLTRKKTKPEYNRPLMTWNSFAPCHSYGGKERTPGAFSCGGGNTRNGLRKS